MSFVMEENAIPQESTVPVEEKVEEKKGFNPIYIFAGIILIGLVGAFLVMRGNKSSVQSPATLDGETSQTSSPNSSAESKTFTMEEVSTHNTSSDCWLVINGNVYNVTGFIPNHPGKEAILQGCGKDATPMFNSRPNIGTSHSNRARSLLPGLQIGTLSGN